MTSTDHAPATRRWGTRRPSLLSRASGPAGALVVALLVLTLPWAGQGREVHALRSELAGAKAALRAAPDVVEEEPPEAFGAGSPGGLGAGARVPADPREKAAAVQARVRHAERRAREAEAALEETLARAATAGVLGGLVEQVRSLVHPPRDEATAGRLRAPVQGVVTSGFGPRRVPSWDGARIHEGIDIFAPSGAPVEASAPGHVVFAGSRPESGLSVVVDHGLDREGRVLQTVYSHLSSITVDRGQHVRAGEALGTVGSTGTHSTGPHLHFEVRLEGKPVDPRAWL